MEKVGEGTAETKYNQLALLINQGGFRLIVKA